MRGTTVLGIVKCGMLVASFACLYARFEECDGSQNKKETHLKLSFSTWVSGFFSLYFMLSNNGLSSNLADEACINALT